MISRFPYLPISIIFYLLCSLAAQAADRFNVTLSQSTAVAGSNGFKLRVFLRDQENHGGDLYKPTQVVRWDGAPRVTRLVIESFNRYLEADITQTDLASPRLVEISVIDTSGTLV